MRAKAGALVVAALVILAACSSGATNSTDPVGTWSVTYGAPTTVAITSSAGTYTITAAAPVEVIGSKCFLPAGTLLATFRGTAGSYAGQHGLWWTSDCSFDRQASVTLALDASGQKLSVTGGLGGPVVYTRTAAASTNDTILLLVILVLAALAAVVAFLIIRRRRRQARMNVDGRT